MSNNVEKNKEHNSTKNNKNNETKLDCPKCLKGGK